MAKSDGEIPFTDDQLSVEAIVTTDQLHKRPSRAPNHRAECEAFRHLVKMLADSPSTILQELVEVAMDTCGADSAGVSTLETFEGREIFRWHALAGRRKPFIHGTLSRHDSPCGWVTDRRQGVMMSRPVRHFKFIAGLGLPIEEVLLIPFYQQDKPMGTLWVMNHVADKHFDAEDFRMIKSLAAFAATANETQFRASAFSRSTERSNLLTAVIESSKDFIGIAIPDGKACYVNPAGLKMVGLDTSEQAIGTRILDYFPLDERRRAETKILPQVYEKGHWDGRVQFRHFATGEVIPFSLNVFSVRDPATGEVAALACISKDLREADKHAQLLAESNLRTLSAHRKLEDLLTSMPVGVSFLEGPRHQYVFTNNCHAGFFGGRSNFIGRCVHECLPDDEIKKILPLLDHVYQTGAEFHCDEFPLLLPQQHGELRQFYLKVAYTPLRDSERNIYGICATAIDVTDRVRARNELQASTDRLKQAKQLLKEAVQVAKVGFFDWDVQRDVVTLSEQMQTDWGLANSEDLATTLSRIHPDDRARVHKTIEMCVEQRCHFLSQYRVVRPDQTLIWIEAQGEVVHDKGGRPVRFFGTSIDITAKKQSEQVFQKILDEIPLFVALLDPDGRVLRINETATRVMKQKHDECLGLHISELSAWRDLENSQTYLKKVLLAAARGEAQRFDIQYSALIDGQTQVRWADVLIQPILNDRGDITTIVKTAFDITDRLEREKELAEARTLAERANATKSSFLANMSHEIRTPLGAIMGFADLLKERNLDADERKQYLETITRNSKALTRIIDDILDLAKVESGKLDIEQVEFSFVSLITESVDLFGERAKSKGIYIRVNLRPQVPDNICSDPTRLRQILINLIGNAVKFTNRGGIEIDVANLDPSQPSYHLQISIRDTGVGIESDKRERLFQPFTQADNTTSRKFGGTGLGLVLSKRLANALGGDIELVECAVDKGCTFVLSFVANRPAKIEARRAPSQQLEPLGDKDRLRLQGVRVLVADDSTDNQTLVRHILAANGANVDVANNGAEAFRMGMRNCYDIVLMDIQMPELDGYKSTRALRDAGFNKPIIAFTAHAMAEERARTRAAGCDGHLTKPLNQDDLLRAVEHQVGAQH